jgi:prolyl oligopeptidase
MCPVSIPHSTVQPVTDILHGVPVTDPYRWLEDQNSPETRAWIEAQTTYARSYLDGIPGRERMRERVRELLDVESFDSFLKAGTRYFFRKRLPGQEQPSIYFRERPDGEDQLLVDPATRRTGDYTAVKPLRASPDGSLLLYEVKRGGERMGTFELLDVANRTRLPDSLPHGYLRGFAFAPDGKSFYYAHEAVETKRPFHRAAYQHTLGKPLETDREIFFAGEDEKVRLAIVAGPQTLGLLVYRFLDKIYTDFYIYAMGATGEPIPVLRNADYRFAPRLLPGRILASTDRDAPNRRIVEVQPRKNRNPLYFDLVHETDTPIRNWSVSVNHILVSYVRGTRSQIVIFDQFGKSVGEIPCDENDSVRLLSGSPDDNEVLLERESFTRPIEIVRCSIPSCQTSLWAQPRLSLAPAHCAHTKVSFPSKDGTTIPMFLVGRNEVLTGGTCPTIMTSYGGYAVSSTPQFSVFVTFLVEQGCLFALPNIRGGSEFGASWHLAARRRNRQLSFDDFLTAAEWLVHTGRTTPASLGIFGGSNAGLLVGAAMTQRPDLFRAVLCMVPMLDMLRYQLFDNAHVWKEEFGTSDDPEDFDALLNYSPYHGVREGTEYPAVMIVSGDADQNCNPLHARKMTAKLQAANVSGNIVLLDYNPHRGHSPVLPLTERIEALTDRVAFVSDQLRLPPRK